MNVLTPVPASFAAVALVSCSFSGSSPLPFVTPNRSGISVGKFVFHDASYLIARGEADGKMDPPDFPPGSTAVVRRENGTHNTEPRYFITASGQLQVVTLGPYKSGGQTYPNDPPRAKEWKKLTEAKRTMGDQDQRMLATSQLLEIPWMNAGICFHAKIRRKEFPWGKAVMFLTSYVQGRTGSQVNNDMLVLVVQGFTNEGSHAVNGRFPISHAKLPDLDWKLEYAESKVKFSLDDDDVAAEAWLDSQPDDSFSPTMVQYEDMLSHLEIPVKKPTR